MKKQAIIGMLLGISVLGLYGCKNVEEPVTPIENSVVEATEETSVNESVFPEDLALGENETEPEDRPHESRNPSTVLEDEETVYFCGRQHILKWDKQTQATDVIWIKRP